VRGTQPATLPRCHHNPKLPCSYYAAPPRGVQPDAENPEVFNHALVGLPADRIRYHLCWGSWHGPHANDVPLAAIAHGTNIVEHPELVAERIVRYADRVGAENVIAGTDCGSGSRIHPELGWAKHVGHAGGNRPPPRPGARPERVLQRQAWRRTAGSVRTRRNLAEPTGKTRIYACNTWPSIHVRVMFTVGATAGAIELSLIVDTAYLPRDIATSMLVGIEALIVGSLTEDIAVAAIPRVCGIAAYPGHR
jgi:hypothetical protein